MAFFNLIPEEEQKKMRAIYRLRLLSIALLVCGVAGFFAVVTLLPSLFVVKVKHNAVVLEVAVLEEKKDGTDIAEVSKALEELSIQTAFLGKQKNTKEVAAALASIIALAPQGILLNRFTYSFAQDTEVKNISLSGVADTRERLVLFARALEEVEWIDKVVVPLANLAGNHNIAFSITITFK